MMIDSILLPVSCQGKWYDFLPQTGLFLIHLFWLFSKNGVTSAYGNKVGYKTRTVIKFCNEIDLLLRHNYNYEVFWDDLKFEVVTNKV